MKKHFIAAMLFLSSFFAFTSVALAGADPVSMLNSVASQMITSLKNNQATLRTNPTIVYSLAYKIVVPHADLDVMAKNVLPPKTWAQASSGQKAAFKKEFTTLLVRTYASALAEYKNETVKFFPIRGGYAGKSTVTVDSSIVRSDGPNIGVTYRVVNTGSQWKLYDMSVEGVSMLQSFRSQFADKLSAGSIGDLINALRQHNVQNSRA